MNNKTINFNCGQLIQLIGKTINFSEPLILSALRQIESENVFTFLSTINKDETTQVRATTHKQTYRRKREASTNTSRKANLVRHEQRLGTSRKLIRTWFDFVFVDGR